ncbi:MAG: LamG-like jellyroll fold domain-containing protein, partial [Chloroflexota bacterium]
TFQPVSADKVSLSGEDGTDQPQVLAARGLTFTQSLDSASVQVEFSALDMAGHASQSRKVLIVSLNPSNPPLLQSPMEGQLLGSGSLGFSWGLQPDIPAASISSFQIQVSSTADFSAVILDSTTAAPTFVPEMPLVDGFLYWRVRALDNLGDWSPYSESRGFNLDLRPPEFSAPQAAVAGLDQFGDFSTVFSSPALDVRITVQDARSGLEMGAWPGAFAVRYSTDGGLTFIEVPAERIGFTGERGTLEAQTLSATGLEFVQSVDTSSLQVEFSAFDLTGNSATVRHALTVLLNPSAPPNPRWPIGAVNTAKPDFVWEPASHVPAEAIEEYQVQVALDEGFSNLRFASATAAGVFAPEEALDEGGYYWRVRAKDKFGTLSPYTAAQHFIVDVTSPGMTGPEIAEAGSGVFGDFPDVFTSTSADVRVTARDALSGLDILANAGGIPRESLLGYWRFDGDFKDSSGNGNDLVSWDSPEIRTDIKVSGQGAYYSEWSLDTVFRDPLPGWEGGNHDVTISAWVRHSGDTGARRGIISITNPSVYQTFGLYISNPYSEYEWALKNPTCSSTNQQIMVMANEGYEARYICAPAPTNADQWYHAAASYDSARGEVKLYVNGRLERTIAVPALLPMGQRLVIGGDQDQQSYVEGFIDDAMVYGRALSDAEVRGLFDSGSGARSFSVRYTTDGGVSYKQAPGDALSSTGEFGTTEPQVLTARGLAFTQSADSSSVQVEFSVKDAAGNAVILQKSLTVLVNSRISPIPKTPSDGEVVTNAAPEFSWELDPAVPLAAIESFQFQLASAQDFASPTVDLTVPEPHHMPTEAMAQGVHYWRVRAKDKFGFFSPFTEARRLVLDAASPEFSNPQIAASGSGQFQDFTSVLHSTWADARVMVRDWPAGLG